MPTHELLDYRSRAARALVLLHEQELRELLDVWRKAKGAAIRLPATTNPNYASLQTVLLHVLKAARNYLVWVCEKLGLPEPGVDEPPAADRLEAEAARYLEHLVARWRVPLGGVDPARFRECYETRWGTQSTIEGMLEHAVAHPLRHAFQLRELMEAALAERSGDR